MIPTTTTITHNKKSKREGPARNPTAPARRPPVEIVVIPRARQLAALLNVLLAQLVSVEGRRLERLVHPGHRHGSVAVVGDRGHEQAMGGAAERDERHARSPTSTGYRNDVWNNFDVGLTSRE